MPYALIDGARMLYALRQGETSPHEVALESRRTRAVYPELPDIAPSKAWEDSRTVQGRV